MFTELIDILQVGQEPLLRASLPWKKESGVVHDLLEEKTPRALF